ncbi:MAG: peroxiredoxin [Verrucomicrobia bacterium]|jgi:peroxiredoxin Q/BCP|nr:peroxiredoxin [Verrucomicrobiota bacterium]
MANKPEVGSPAPQFTAPVVGGDYPEGATLSLSDLAGQTVVLYFYPKDNTPGCTTQACDLRDNWAAVSAKARVFGVSPDGVKSHRKFIDGHSLPFPLIADPDKKIVNDYGVWIEKSMMGRLGFGTERTTFVIGPDQKIKAVFPKVKPKEHVAQLLGVI